MNNDEIDNMMDSELHEVAQIHADMPFVTSSHPLTGNLSVVSGTGGKVSAQGKETRNSLGTKVPRMPPDKPVIRALSKLSVENPKAAKEILEQYTGPSILELARKYQKELDIRMARHWTKLRDLYKAEISK